MRKSLLITCFILAVFSLGIVRAQVGLPITTDTSSVGEVVVDNTFVDDSNRFNLIHLWENYRILISKGMYYTVFGDESQIEMTRYDENFEFVESKAFTSPQRATEDETVLLKDIEKIKFDDKKIVLKFENNVEGPVDIAKRDLSDETSHIDSFHVYPETENYEFYIDEDDKFDLFVWYSSSTNYPPYKREKRLWIKK